MTKRTFVAIDIETTGLNPNEPHSKIFCVAINTGSTIKVETDISKLKPLLEDKSICKVVHNAAFDCFWLKTLYNIDTVNIWDTKLMEQVILGDNLPRTDADKIPEPIKEQLSSSLVYTLKRYGLADISKTKWMGEHFSKRDRNKPLTTQEKEYAKDDVRYLLQLQAMQEFRLVQLDLMRVANLENKVVEVVYRMRRLGISIDKDKWLQLEAQNRANYDYIIKRLPSTVNNWNSPAQVKKYFNSVGIPLRSFDDLTDDFVNAYNNTVLRKFVEARGYSTTASKYGSNFLIDKKTGRYFIDHDGRIRADFDQIVTTGRFSCSKPPLHGLPREGEQRGAFIPAKGHRFGIGDFGGQETGIMAAASGEELWIKSLLRGEDPLSLMASLMFPDWVKNTEKGCVFPKKCKCPLHKRDRQISKEITYGMAYGSSAMSISKKIKRSHHDTLILFKKHRRSAPKLNRFLEENAKQTIATRISYSADIYRRRRTIRDPEEWMVKNVGYNNPIQACAANMIKLSMISLSPSIPIVFPWHDELIIEPTIKEAPKAIKELKIIMEKSADYCTGIPGLIKVEPRIAMNLLKQ